MLKSIARWAVRKVRPPVPFGDYLISSDRAPEFAQQMEGDLARIFFSGNGRTVHKWLHFLPIYETHFAKYRNTPVKMLEIGVAQGGSLDMWRAYLGNEAKIYGIDVDPQCADRVSPPNQVRIGTQDDPELLKSVIEEMGAPDIILDDGSHIGRHQEATFKTLFPLLKEGGLYIIEDLHTSYWGGEWEGGYGKRKTGIGLIKQIIDDMHAWYHHRRTQTPSRDFISAVHIYDSITVLEKRHVPPPQHIHIPSRH